MTWQDVARLAHFVPDIPPGLEPGLDERVFYDPKGLTFPFGTYIAVVDVDPATGDIVIDRFVAVDDCGPLINPLLARGQVHGGIAQGLGQALLEGARYDSEGSLASHDWTTYAFPRAQHVPRLETEHTVTPSPFTFRGIKGIGEAGAIGTPPAIVNAVLDALHAARVHGGEKIGRQDVPVVIGAALQAHEQDVHRTGLRASGEHVRTADAADLALHVVGEAASDQDEGGKHAAKRVADFADDRHPRMRPEHGSFRPDP